MRKFSIALVTGFGLLLCALPQTAHAEDKLQPGQWRSVETVQEMVNPVLSPAVIARRKAKPAEVSYCVRSESIQELIIGKDAGGLCSGEATISGGKISALRSCTSGLGKGIRKITGTYTATKIETDRETQQESPKGEMRSKTHVVSERIGECP